MRFTMKSNILYKLAAICGFLLVSAAMIIAWLNPCTGYELDIYNSTPVATWSLIGLSLAIAAGILLYQLFSGDYKYNRFWILGLALLITCRLALLWVPYARGYFAWEGDNITHWGMIEDILKTGHLYSENSYPLTHSFLAQIISVTGLPLKTVANLSTGLFSAFNIMLVLLLAKRVTADRGYQLAAALTAGLVPLLGGYNIYLMPNGWSIFLMPLLFFLYFGRKEDSGFNTLLILMLILYPFFHPLSSLVLLISFFLLFISAGLYWLFSAGTIGFNDVSTATGKPFFPAMIQCAILLPWVFSFDRYVSNIHKIWLQLTTGSSSQFERIGNTLAKIDVAGWDSVVLFFKLYGAAALMIAASVISIIWFIIKINKDSKVFSSMPFLIMGGLMLFFFSLYILYLVDFPAMHFIGAGRMLSYVLLFSPLATGYLLYKMSQGAKYKTLSALITIIFIGTAGFLGIYGLYAAPYQVKPNAQVTAYDMAGSEWFIKTKNPLHKSGGIISPINRYADGLLGRQAVAMRPDLQSSRVIKMEDHFGYTQFSTLGEHYRVNILLNITTKDRIVYTTVWDTVGRFDTLDFSNLCQDYSVNKVYENGEYSIFFIRPDTDSDE
jgi:hypothetical protein